MILLVGAIRVLGVFLIAYLVKIDTGEFMAAPWWNKAILVFMMSVVFAPIASGKK